MFGTLLLVITQNVSKNDVNYSNFHFIDEFTKKLIIKKFEHWFQIILKAFLSLGRVQTRDEESGLLH